MSAEKKISYMTMKEVAEYAHVSIRHLKEEISRKNIRAYKPGKFVLFEIDEVNKWVKKKAIS